MRIALAFVALTLTACDHDTTGHDIRTQANAMRVEVNAASSVAKTVGAYIPFVCNLRGEDSRECNTLHDGYEAVRRSVEAASAAIDLYDDTGVMLAGADAAARGIREGVEAFATAVRKAVEAAHGLESVARESRGDGDRQTAQPTPAAEAPAEGEGAGAAESPAR